MKAVMIQGTGSHVGKSVTVAAVCRILYQDGYRVCPFKSQNMALNSFVTATGGEMGRAQVMQAEACGLEPKVFMNPVLIKPVKDTAAQVILMGRVVGNMSAGQYDNYKQEFMPKIKQIIGDISSRFDYLVIEGAGSPAEINLLKNDIVNMATAQAADAPVILVADIDKGGVFASFYGTVKIMPAKWQKYFKGLLINKFRGDKKLLDPGIKWIEEKLKLPVVGTIPYFTNILLDEEDSVNLEKQQIKNRSMHARFRVAIVYLPHISNFTDFNFLDTEQDVEVSYIKTRKQLKESSPHLIILPGSKSTISDLEYLKKCGLAGDITQAYRRGASVIGICGGYQMLGSTISDPYGVETEAGSIGGLGLLDIETDFLPEKYTSQVQFKLNAGALGAAGFSEYFTGYEIHMGTTRVEGLANPFYVKTESIDKPEGCIKVNREKGNMVMGTYIHGLFDNHRLRNCLLEYLAGLAKVNLNLKFNQESSQVFKQKQYDKLADLFRCNMDMETFYKIINAGL